MISFAAVFLCFYSMQILCNHVFAAIKEIIMSLLSQFCVAFFTRDAGVPTFLKFEFIFELELGVFWYESTSMYCSIYEYLPKMLCRPFECKTKICDFTLRFFFTRC
jgi:hypothetical protein